MSDGSIQAASQAESITRELSIGEVLSRTFAIYRRNLVKFVIIYVIVGAILGASIGLLIRSIIVPSDVVGAAGSTTVNAADALSTVFFFFAVLILISVIFYPIEIGSAIKMASDEIEKGETSLAESLKFMVRRLVWFWVATIIVTILVTIGSILLFVPGIILAIMFSMVPPVIVIEKAGPLASLGRSRTLVSHRWLKTFAFGLVVGLMVFVPVIILELIGEFAGLVGSILAYALSAFILPIVPIALTVYYYSNLARTTPQQQAPPTVIPSVPVAGVRYCPNCGTQLPANATFCTNCGAKLDN